MKSDILKICNFYDSLKIQWKLLHVITDNFIIGYCNQIESQLSNGISPANLANSSTQICKNT